MDENSRLRAGWPFDLNADYTATWDRIEQRAGRNISHKERTEMQEAGIVFSGCTGRPPDRIRFVFLYWPQYLQWMTQRKIERMQKA